MYQVSRFGLAAIRLRRRRRGRPRLSNLRRTLPRRTLPQDPAGRSGPTSGPPRAAQPPHSRRNRFVCTSRTNLAVPWSPSSASRSFHTRRGAYQCCRRPSPTAHLPPTCMRKVDFAISTGIQVFRRPHFPPANRFGAARTSPASSRPPRPVRPSARAFDEPRGGEFHGTRGTGPWKTLHRHFFNPPRPTLCNPRREFFGRRRGVGKTHVPTQRCPGPGKSFARPPRMGLPTPL